MKLTMPIILRLLWIAAIGLWAAVLGPSPRPLAAAPSADAEAQRPDAVVVCPAALRDTLDVWLRRRAAEGLAVRVVAPAPSAQETRRRVIQAADLQQTRYVMLLGGSQRDEQGRMTRPEAHVPTIYTPADATSKWQQTTHLAGDYLYGDFNSDGRANAAVGRLPVGSPQEAEQVFRRIAAYETSRDFGPWRQRVELVAGLGGFGPLVDGAIEAVAAGLITASLPASVRTRVTHAGPNSPFHPGQHGFTETVLENYAHGARFWVYAGHGHVCELDRVPATPQGRPVLCVDDCQQLARPAQAAPIALLLACYTGAHDAAVDCLAQRMMLTPGGPIAVLAGSRVTMPYGNAAAAMALIQSVYYNHPARLGDAWLQTLDELATPSDADAELQSRRLVIDSLATLLGDGRHDDERREHMQLYNWLGDPTMRLTHPQPMTIEAPKAAQAGAPVSLRGHAPLSGTMRIELHRRPGPSTDNINGPVADHPAGGTADTTTAQRYRLANRTQLASEEIGVVDAGRWETTFRLPPEVSGPLRLLVDLQGEAGYASGAHTIWVR